MKPSGGAVAVSASASSKAASVAAAQESRPVADKDVCAGGIWRTGSKVAAWLVLPIGGALLGLQVASSKASSSSSSSRHDTIVRTAAPLAGGLLLAAMYSRAIGGGNRSSKKPTASQTLQTKGKHQSTTVASHPVPVKVWSAAANVAIDNANAVLPVPFPELDDPEFRIPALDDKAPLAICISGGGVRATTLGLGWLRALHELGVLQRAKYLMTTSGASWLNGAVSFQRGDLGEFLGPYLPPSACSLEALKQVGDRSRSYAAAVASAEPLVAYVHDLLKKVAEVERQQGRHAPAVQKALQAGLDAIVRIWKKVKHHGAEARAWTQAMTTSFLEPFGLGDTDASTVTAAGTQGNVHLSVVERATQAGRGTVYVTDPRVMPFPVMTQVVLMPGRTKYYPFEWTPLYGGCPVPYSSTKPKLGAGWVENLGLNARLLDKPKQPAAGAGGGPVTVRVRPTGPGSLGEAIGVSSAFGSMTAGLQNLPVFGKLMHKWLGWHTAEYFNTMDYERGELELTDGGGTDLFAIFPALRRRVPNMIVCAASTVEILEYDSFLAEMRDLAMLFGCWTQPSPDEDPLNGQVFPSSGFRELFDALKAKVAAGKPAVHVAEYEVMANPQQGVPGGWRARVMWVLNARQSGWEAALPRETRERLQADRAAYLRQQQLAQQKEQEQQQQGGGEAKPKNKVLGEVKQLVADNTRDAVFFDFPLVSTFYSAYPPELVSMLSNHAAWSLIENRQLVASMLGAEAKLPVKAAPAAVPATAAAAAAVPPPVLVTAVAY